MKQGPVSDLPKDWVYALTSLLVIIGAAGGDNDRDVLDRVRLAERFLTAKLGEPKLNEIRSAVVTGQLSYSLAPDRLCDLLKPEDQLALKNLVNRRLGFPDDETCDQFGGWASRIPFVGQGVAGRGWRRLVKWWF